MTFRQVYSLTNLTASISVSKANDILDGLLLGTFPLPILLLSNAFGHVEISWLPHTSQGRLMLHLNLALLLNVLLVGRMRIWLRARTCRRHLTYQW
jgi:hypothetical protein